MATDDSMAKFHSIPLACILLISGLCISAGGQTSGTLVKIVEDGGSGERSSLTVAGRPTDGWQIQPGKGALVKPESDFKVPADGNLYLELTYLDRGYGRLELSAKAGDAKPVKPAKHTRLMLMDSGSWMTTQIQFTSLKPGEVPEVRVSLARDPQNTLVIGKGRIQAEVFPNPIFQYLVREDWKRPYAGSTLRGAVANTTLKGKAMVGYQGWFRTPNDPYDSGWIHWGNMQRGDFSIDMWPDTSAYPPEALEKAANVKTLSGKTAYLFSSASPHVVRQHFAWMRKHDIDGAFLQRFINAGTYATTGHPEWALGNVRDAANREGRVWAVEYDVSGAPDEKLFDLISRDWKWLVDDFGLKKDPAYAKEGTKPVVFVWGLAVGGRNIRPETAEKIFDFLKNDPTYGGNYVIGGLPGNWRKLGPEWQNHIRQQDGTLAWMSQSFSEDIADFKKLGIDYFPHVKPGFSWANLKHIATGAKDAYTPREGGAYYEAQLEKVIQAGGDRLFVGMYDEYDEGTAIIPMSDDPPPTPQRPGVNAKIYGTDRWEGRAVTKNPPQFDLDLSEPPGRGVPDTHYQIAADGSIIPPADGSYRFSVEGPTGGSATLQVGDTKLKLKPFPEATPSVLTVNLKAGERMNYKVDYRHESTPGRLQLFWEGPGISRQLIPASALVDAWGRFVTNEGKPADLYLTLTGKWKKKLPEVKDVSQR